jgi:hypothetical protein
MDILHVTDEFEPQVLLRHEKIALNMLLNVNFDWRGLTQSIRVFRNALLSVALECALPLSLAQSLPYRKHRLCLLICELSCVYRMPLPANESHPDTLIRPGDPELHVVIVDGSVEVLDLHQHLVRQLRPTARIFAYRR